MMACSYLSAGGLKSEPTSAACWSPPAMTGCLAAESRPLPIALPTPAMTLPTPTMPLSGGPMDLQNEPIGSSGPMGLPRASLALPRTPMSPREQLLLPNPVGSTQSMGLSRGSMLQSATVGQTSLQMGLSSRQLGPSVPAQPNPQIGLPSPFGRAMPLDLHSGFSQTIPSTEPALDLSASAPMTSSLKPRLSPPDEKTE